MRVQVDLSPVLTRALLLLMFGCLGFNSTAWAADEVIEEIVVTAEKRESALQKTPVAITALTSSMVEERNLDDLRKISQLVPSMLFNTSGGSAMIYMRGVGTDNNSVTAEPGVAMFVDGVYMGTTSEQSATFDNVERVEVLRGPQGTLYGRNSTGGNLNIFTKLPGAEPEFSASLLYGDHDRVKASFSAGGVLVDDLLAARVSLVKDSDDGYSENLFNGDDVDHRDITSAMFSAVFTPTDTFEFILRGDWSETESDNPLWNYGEIVPDSGISPLLLGGQTGTGPRKIRNNDDTDYDREFWGVSGTANWDIGDVTLRSITAYRETVNDGYYDTDGTDIPYIFIVQTQDSEMFSQEFNLLGSIGENVQWILGAYYFDQETVSQYEFDLPALQPVFEGIFEGIFGLPPGSLAGFLADPGLNPFYGKRIAGGPSAIPFLDFTNSQDTRSTALFAQGTYHVSDRLRVTAGVRWTDDEKKSLGTVVNNISPDGCVDAKNEADWQETTYKLSADFDISDSAMLYGSYSTGYKSGGFNTGACNDSFDPETVDAFEVGLKSTLADGRLRLNLAAYVYDYDDYQAEIIRETFSSVENAAKLENMGLELEFLWLPVHGLQIDGSVAIMDSEFEEFVSDDPMTPVFELVDASGNQTLRAPDLTYNVGLQYTLDLERGGDITLRYEAAHKDDYYVTVFNNDFAQVDSHTLQNVRGIWNVNSQWEVQAFVENLTDEDVPDSLTVGDTIGGTANFWAPPRLWGVQLRYTM